MLRLRVERKKRGLTQVKLCQLTDIAPADVSAIERGTKKPWPGWRKRIAAALGVSGAEADRLFEEVTADEEATN